MTYGSACTALPAPAAAPNLLPATRCPDRASIHLCPGQGAASPPPSSPRIWASKTEHSILRVLPRCHRLVRWAILGDRLGAWHTQRAAGNSLLLLLQAGGWDPAGTQPCDSQGLTLL